MAKKLSASEKEALSYNTKLSGLKPDVKSSKDWLEDVKTTPVKDFELSYGSENSPAGLRPGATSGTRVDFGDRNPFGEERVFAKDEVDLPLGILADEDIQQAKYEQQSAINKTLTGLGRLAPQTLLKGAQGFSFLGSLIGESGLALADSATGGTLLPKLGYDGQWDWEDVTNNAVNDILAKTEEAVKDSYRVNKPTDWNDKNFLQQLGDSAWWADEGADGIAFALSNFIPAGALGKLGIGTKVARGLEDIGIVGAGKMGRISEPVRELLRTKVGILSNPTKLAKGIDEVVQNAFMTSSEALFEAKDTSEQIKNNLLQQYNRENPQASVESWDELPDQFKASHKESIGEAMRNTFMYNAAALWFSNKIELGMANKLFGKGEHGSMRNLINTGENITDQAGKVASKGIKRYLDTRAGQIGTSVLKNALVEGAYEENIQNAIQNVDVNFGTAGKSNYLLNTVDDVVEGFFENFNDKEAWKSIGSGMVIGGLFGGASDFKQSGKDAKRAAILQSQLNSSTKNFINLKDNLYEKEEVLDETGNPTGEFTIKRNEEGKPVLNTKHIAEYRANVSMNKDLADLHDLYKQTGDEELAEVMKNEVITNWAYAHLEAGFSEDMYNKAKSLSSFKDEDLASLGIDPIEVEEGKRVSKEEKSKALIDKLKQIEEDYNQVSKTIDQESEPARHQESLAKISRVRELNKIANKLAKKQVVLESKIQNNNISVQAINKAVRTYKALVANLPVMEAKSSEERLNNYKKQIAEAENTIRSLKAENAEDLLASGYKVDDTLDSINSDETKLPEYKEALRVSSKLVEVDQAAQDQLDDYNSITDFRKGRENFAQYLAKNLNLEESDEISFTEEGVKKKGIIFEKDGEKFARVYEVNDRGQNISNNIVERSLTDIKNTRGITDLVELASREQSFNENSSVQTKESRTKEFVKEILNKEFQSKNKQYAKIIEDQENLKDLISQDELKSELLREGYIRVSQKELAKQLKALDKSIQTNQDLLDELESRRQIVLLDMEYLQNNKQNYVDNGIRHLESLNKELEETNAFIEEQKSLIDRLKQASAFFRGILKQGFGKANFENTSTFKEAKTSISVNRQQQNQIKKTIEELNQYKSSLEEKITKVQASLTLLSDKLNGLNFEVYTPEPASNPREESKPEATQASQHKGFTRLRQAFYGFLATGGSHVDNDKNLTNSNSQKRWFKFTETFDVSNKSGHKLRTVKIDDPVYGLGKDSDIFSEEAKQYQNENNIKVLVVDKNGNPITFHGNLVYTSLIEPKDNISDYKNYANTKNKITQEEIEERIKIHKNTLKSIKDSKSPIFLEITGKSSGIPNTDFEKSLGEAFGKDNEVKLYINYKRHNKEAGIIVLDDDHVLEKAKGLVYMMDKFGRIISPNINKLSEKTANEIVKNLKDYVKIKGDKSYTGSLLNFPDTLASIIYMQDSKRGKEGDENLDFFFTKINNRLKVGKELLDLKSVEEGKHDDLLKAFLLNKKHQVDAGLVKDNKSYTDVFGRKWKNYTEYLTTKRNEISNTPLTTNIVAFEDSIDSPQFFSSYLTFRPEGSNIKYSKSDKQSKSSNDFNEAFKTFVIPKTTTTLAEEVKDLPKPKEKSKEITVETKDKEALIIKEDTLFPIQEPIQQEAKNEAIVTKMGMTGASEALSESEQKEVDSILNQLKGRSEEEIKKILKRRGFIYNTKATTQSVALTEEKPSETQEEVDDGLEEEALDLLSNITPKEYKPANLDKELKWFQERFPNIPFSKVKGLIDGKSFGRFLAQGKILISDLAIEGTVYHEAFHTVSQLYLTDRERKVLYNNYLKTITNDELKSLQDKNPTYSLGRIIEEELAEGFRDFVLSGGEKIKEKSIIEKIFDSIVKAIRWALGLNNTDIQTLYKNIQAGKFSKAEIVSNKYIKNYDSVFDGYTEDFRRGLLDSMTYLLFNKLFGSNFSTQDLIDFSKDTLSKEDKEAFQNVYDSILNQIKGAWGKLSRLSEQEARENKDKYWNFVYSNWENIKREHLVYLAEFGLNIKLEDIEVRDDLEPENRGSKDTLGILPSNEFSPKDLMKNQIKLLIASLPKMNAKGELELNHLGLPAISDRRRNMAILHNNLAGADSFQEQIERLKKLSETYPEFNKLLKGLKVQDGIVTSTNLTNAEFQLQNQFKNQFDKAYLEYKNLTVDDNGHFVQMDANANRLEKIIETKWSNNLRFNSPEKNQFLKVENGIYTFNKEVINQVVKWLEEKRELRDKDDQQTFKNSLLSIASNLGILFTDKDNVSYSVLLNKLTPILKEISNNPTEVFDLFDESLKINSFIKDLIKLETPSRRNDTDNQHINAEGRTVYSITLNDYLSIITRKLTGNKEDLPEHLVWNEETKTGNINVRNSSWINKKVSLEVLSGIFDRDQNKGTSTSDLTNTDNLIQHIKSTFNNTFALFRAGDKKLEKAFKVSYNLTNEKEVEDQILGYLADEMMTTWNFNINGVGKGIDNYEKTAEDLRIFKDLFNKEDRKKIDKLIKKKGQNNLTIEQTIKLVDKEVQKDYVRKAVQDMLSKQYEDNFKFFEDNRIFEKTGERYEALGVDLEVLNSFKFNLENKFVSKEQAEKVVREFTNRDLIAKIEQTKLITGDLGFYKDFFKRVGGIVGTGRTFRNDIETNNWLNINAKREDNKTSDGIINSVVYSDVKVKSNLYNEYVKALESTGNFTEKEIKDLLSAYERMDEADAQGYLTLPEFRESMLRAGDWSDSMETAYRKAVKGQSLTKEELAYFQPQKLQYFGPQIYEGLYVPTFYKYSVMPLIPSVIKGTNLEKLNTHLMNNGLGMAMFKTANKVGNTAINQFYKEDGTINDGELGIQKINYDYLKIQLDIDASIKTKVTFGTQFRKLILGNLANKSITIGGQFVKGNDLITKYNSLINKLIDLDTKQLQEELSIENLGDGNFAIKNKEKLKEFLKDQTVGRSLPDNVRQGIEQVFESESKKLDVLVNRDQLENLLASLISNNIIKQKVFGDMKIQAASTGFETKARKQILNGEGVQEGWESNLETLNFYKQGKNGTTRMEVYLPHYFKEMLGINLDVSEITDKRLLELVGFRIPTQGLNSIEAITIKGFLPPEAGSVIITPSEIVAKAGSDYDIDKLTVFFPNYKVNYNWKEMQDLFLLDYPELKGNQYGNLKDIVELAENTNNILSLEEQEVYNKWVEFSKEAKKSSDFIKSLEYLEYKEGTENKKAIQNEIMKMASDIALAPENFVSLIMPNSSSEIKELAKEISPLKKGGVDLNNRNAFNYLTTKFNSAVRQAFLLGKVGVGITALQNVHHVIGQISGLRISNPNITINLNHNQTEDGRIDLSQEYAKGKKKMSIIDTISQFLNAFVDIANDPFLININANSETANIYFYLLRAGVPLEDAVYFMNQPIITDYLNDLEANNSVALEAQNKTTSRYKIKKQLERKYASVLEGNAEEILSLYKQNVKDNNFLKKQITNPTNNFQIQILNDYLAYEASSRELVDLVNASKFDTEGNGKDLTNTQLILDNHEEVLNRNYFEGAEDSINNTFLGGFKKAVQSSLGMFKDLFVTELPEVKELLKSIRDDLNIRNKEDLTRVMSIAKNNLISYILQNSKIDDKILGHRAEELMFGDNSLASRVIDALKTPELKDNFLLKGLFPIVGSEAGTNRKSKEAMKSLKIFNKKLTVEDSNSLTKAWKEIFNINQKLGEDLIYYAILQSGLNNSPVSFLKLAPNENYIRIADKAMVSFIDNVNFEDFEEYFYSNNVENSLINPRPKSYRYIAQENRYVSIVNNGITTLSSKFESKIAGKKSIAIAVEKKLTREERIAYAKSKKRPPKELKRFVLDSVDLEKDRYVYKMAESRGFKYWFNEFVRRPFSMIRENRLVEFVDYNTGEQSEIQLFKQSMVTLKNILDANIANIKKNAEFTKRIKEAKTYEELAKLEEEICTK